MRGIGYALSRLPNARALFAGAAIIAGAFTSAAHGQSSGSGNGTGIIATDGTRTDQAAFAIPHMPHDGASGVAFPRPLRASDASVMQRIFAAQHRGDIPDSIRTTSNLEDPLLLGTVQADRLLGRYYKSTLAELSDWLIRYRDQPDALAVYRLLLTKLPKGAQVPPAPDTVVLGRPAETDSALEDIDPPRDDLARLPWLDRGVVGRAGRGDYAAALKLIAGAKGISAAYTGQLRAETAQIAFTRNDDETALSIAQMTVQSAAADDQSALAWYIGGLAAWRLDRFDVAKTMFEGGASAAVTSPRLHAATAFWASRVSRRSRDAAATAKWLQLAAEDRLTLHGLLARRILRLNTGIVPSNQLLSQADIDAVAATPNGLRAFALLQIGQPDKAEAELRALWPQASANPAFGQSLLMVASAVGFADCASQMAGLLQARDGSRHEELRFPMPRLRPAGGFRIDPALVYALARLESNFDPEAVSPVGARGLMQIMPETAQYITGNGTLTLAQLHEPAANLAIGQRYVSWLARLDGIDDDLIRVLASYNWGPGNLLHWAAGVHDGGDPLLFIEAIPVLETRRFVQHVLTYSWIYAARLHTKAPSLDSLAAGEFPRFTPLEQERTMAAFAVPAMH